MSESATVKSAEGRITITRVLDAPREAVFAAWTDADQVAAWFGPAGLEVPRESVVVDARVGGRFDLRMVRPGADMEYPLHYEIVELVEPSLLVLRSEPRPEVGLHQGTVARIELEELGGKTRLTITDGPYTDEGGRHAGAGWEQAFDKLEALVAGVG
jgi:uncharacterized protein YndB with AHSA1/START domain